MFSLAVKLNYMQWPQRNSEKLTTYFAKQYIKTKRFALDLSARTHLDITHFLKIQWLLAGLG